MPIRTKQHLLATLLLFCFYAGSTVFLFAQNKKPATRTGGYFTQRVTPEKEVKPDLSGYQKKIWINPAGDTLRYRLLLPENYDASKRYPLVLFLHGAGERGKDNEKQLVHGAGLFVTPEVRKDFPAIVVFPQCDSLDFWSNVNITTNDSSGKWQFEFREDGEPTHAMNLLMQWLPAFEREYAVRDTQRYVMGLSMGGMGTFEIVRRMPKYFAAAIPICGGAHPNTAMAIRGTAFWIFHGQRDNVVPYQFSEKMVLALQDIITKEDVVFTMYPEAYHNSWDPAFAEPDLLPWLFSHTLHLP